MVRKGQIDNYRPEDLTIDKYNTLAQNMHANKSSCERHSSTNKSMDKRNVSLNLVDKNLLIEAVLGPIESFKIKKKYGLESKDILPIF